MNHPIPSLEKLLEVAKEAAARATTIVKEQRRSMNVKVSFKSSRDLVTSADIASEQEIVRVIHEAFPDHKILAEESARKEASQSYGSGIVWVIDPVDGTTNYAHEHFQVGISIACVIDGKARVGVVSAPFYDEVFTAIKGGGAYRNGERIHIREIDSISNALISTGFPYRRDNASNICGRLERLVRQCRDIRRLGAASLDICWVACGRLDAYYEECIQPWDCAAGIVIAREAGAVTGHFAYDHPLQRQTADFPGDLFVDNFFVSGPRLFNELKSILENKVPAEQDTTPPISQ